MEKLTDRSLRTPHQPKLFVLYDGRAKSGDTDAAIAMSMTTTEQQAVRESRDWKGYDAIWYEYDAASGVLENEKPRPDIGKGLLR